MSLAKKYISLVFIGVMFVGNEASATNCSTRLEQDANHEFCKSQTIGIFKTKIKVGTLPYMRCVREREQQDCSRRAREAQEKDSQKAELINKLAGGRDTCYKQGVTPDDYWACMAPRVWVGLDEDIQMLAELCAQHSDICEVSRFATETRDKHRAMDRMAKLRKEQAERDAQQEKEIEKQNEEQERQIAYEAKQEAARKRICGKDYKSVRVGMSFARIKQCTGTFRLTSQINRSDGVVSIYERNGGYVHVMDGRVVAWRAY